MSGAQTLRVIVREPKKMGSGLSAQLVYSVMSFGGTVGPTKRVVSRTDADFLWLETQLNQVIIIYIIVAVVSFVWCMYARACVCKGLYIYHFAIHCEIELRGVCYPFSA